MHLTQPGPKLNIYLFMAAHPSHKIAKRENKILRIEIQKKKKYLMKNEICKKRLKCF